MAVPNRWRRSFKRRDFLLKPADLQTPSLYGVVIALRRAFCRQAAGGMP
jgi:hypothetical protein